MIIFYVLFILIIVSHILSEQQWFIILENQGLKRLITHPIYIYKKMLTNWRINYFCYRVAHVLSNIKYRQNLNHVPVIPESNTLPLYYFATILWVSNEMTQVIILLTQCKLSLDILSCMLLLEDDRWLSCLSCVVWEISLLYFSTSGLNAISPLDFILKVMCVCVCVCVCCALPATIFAHTLSIDSSVIIRMKQVHTYFSQLFFFIKVRMLNIRSM